MVISRQAKNQRQLAESVRNKLKNLLKIAHDWQSKHGKLKDSCAIEVKISDLEEMYSDMVQLNENRLANSNTW